MKLVVQIKLLPTPEQASALEATLRDCKARRAGVPLVQVDPRYTSQTCARCGHRDKRNRPDQETFICRSCGVVAHADHNAALNIAARGVEGRGAVNRPHAA